MFLHILAIIGIVLLCIAAFALLIVLLLLFVPVKYSVKADGADKEIRAQAAAKWLFGIAQAGAEYKDSEIFYSVKILFFSVIKGKIGKEKEPEENAAGSALSKKKQKQKQKKKEKALKKKEAKSLRKEKKRAKINKKNKEKTPEDEALAAEGFKGKLLLMLEKIKTAVQKAKTAKYIWDAPVTKRAISFLKQKIFLLLNHIKPRKIKGRARFALSDPAATAQVYAICAMMLEMMRAQLVLEPDFEGTGYEAENVEIKGRIFAGYMLLLGLQIIKNKDVRRVVKYIRRNF